MRVEASSMGLAPLAKETPPESSFLGTCVASSIHLEQPH